MLLACVSSSPGSLWQRSTPSGFSAARAPTPTCRGPNAAEQLDAALDEVGEQVPVLVGSALR